ncbi:unnamed protein product [Eruca vesicaria subsp. sativa]|uniref:Uncharacterized protein n=1 Tax=Eruca vesicaria subsp. sativa TaxID=29727 RepID=A0ABC8K066_ERUVS|nr:unnamed protein product [Eruca vesicaria subsp. sativa]
MEARSPALAASHSAYISSLFGDRSAGESLVYGFSLPGVSDDNMKTLPLSQDISLSSTRFRHPSSPYCYGHRNHDEYDARRNKYGQHLTSHKDWVMRYRDDRKTYRQGDTRHRTGPYKRHNDHVWRQKKQDGISG